MEFFTNSREERDMIIHKLIASSGLRSIELSQLKINCSYGLRFSAKPWEILPELSPHPDMFWPEKKRDEWNKKAEAYFD